MESRGRRPRTLERQRPAARKLLVVYYLTRSRHLEHPHFVEVPASSSTEGLYLRDVINHLNAVRGKGMAAMYSWSCKRSYKNGFVWQDLAEDDLVHPATDGEYVLKGSELLDRPSSGQVYHGSNGNQKQQSRLKEGARLPLSREASFSSSPPSVTVREAKPRRAPSVPSPDEDVRRHGHAGPHRRPLPLRLRRPHTIIRGERINLVLWLMKLFLPLVKDPDVEGKTVHDKWSTTNGGINEGGPDDDPEAADEEEAALEDLEVEEEAAVEDALEASISRSPRSGGECCCGVQAAGDLKWR